MLGLFIFFIIYILFPFSVIAVFLSKFKILPKIGISTLILISAWGISKGINIVIDLVIEKIIFANMNEHGFILTWMSLKFVLPAFIYFYFICIFSPLFANSINKFKEHAKEEKLKKIFKSMTKPFIVFIYILLLFAILTFSSLLKSHDLKFATDEEKEKVADVLDLEYADSFNPIYICYDGYDGAFYQLKFYISKDEYEKNNLEFYNGKIFGLNGEGCTEKDSNTYECIIQSSDWNHDDNYYLNKLREINKISIDSNFRITIFIGAIAVIVTIIFIVIMKKVKIKTE